MFDNKIVIFLNVDDIFDWVVIFVKLSGGIWQWDFVVWVYGIMLCFFERNVVVVDSIFIVSR